MAAQAQWQQAPIILRYNPIQMYDAAALRRHPSSPGSNGAVNYWFFGSNCDTPAAARSLGLHMWNAKKAAESIGADAGANPIFTGLAREVNGIIRYPLYYLSPPTLQTEEQHDEVTRRFEEDDHSGTLETTGFVAGGLSIWKKWAYPAHSQYYFHVIGRSVASLCMHPRTLHAPSPRALHAPHRHPNHLNTQGPLTGNRYQGRHPHCPQDQRGAHQGGVPDAGRVVCSMQCCCAAQRACHQQHVSRKPTGLVSRFLLTHAPVQGVGLPARPNTH
jgi:hypothetical protein